MSRPVGPSQHGFRLQRIAGGRQRELYQRDFFLGKRVGSRDCHSSFTDVRGGGMNVRAPFENDPDGHFHSYTEIAALFTSHLPERSTKTAEGGDGHQWLLQDKICAHLKGCLR
jgi:hypothetical protein